MTQISDLMVGFYNRTISDILPILYDFILFNLCQQQDQSTLANDKLVLYYIAIDSIN